MSNTKKLMWTGLVTAIGSSLCCIVPLLAAISGAVGLASAFSWVEPLRPYLILVTILVLGFAWYQQLKPKKEMACACDEDKPSFFKSKFYLGLMTLFAILMLSFPYLSRSLNDEPVKQIIVVDRSDVQEVSFDIEGMTCSSCESHINHAIRELDGIVTIQTSFASGNTIVEYEPSKVSKDAIERAIKSTGYTVKK